MSENGSGKTFGVALPILLRVLESYYLEDILPQGQRAAESHPRNEPARPRGLIVVTSQKLCERCRDFVRMLCCGKLLKLRVEAVHNGGGYLEGLAKGTDIIVATPERIVNLIEKEIVSLQELVVVALDDADKLLAGRFFTPNSFVQCTQTLLKYAERSGAVFQRLALSAPKRTWCPSSLKAMYDIILKPRENQGCFFLQVRDGSLPSRMTNQQSGGEQPQHQVGTVVGALPPSRRRTNTPGTKQNQRAPPPTRNSTKQPQHHFFQAVHLRDTNNDQTVVSPSKFRCLLHLLTSITTTIGARRVIVFVNTPSRAELVFQRLHEARERMIGGGHTLARFVEFLRASG